MGYIISLDGVGMDFCKVQTIADWVTSTSIRDVQCFLRFDNFYQRFIVHYSTIVTPFTHLTCKDQPFSWGVEAENAFQSLKALFMTAPLLIHANLSKPFVFETNTSNFALNTTLS